MGLGWFGSRTKGRTGAVTALAVVTGLVVGAGAGATPAGAWDDDTAADVAAWSSALPGFLLRDGQQFASFEVRQADVAMYPSGINDKGQVTGEYVRSDGESAFVRSPDGRMTTFDVPGARATEAAKINDAGQIVGRYSTDTALVDDSDHVRGFVRDGRGAITEIDRPDASHTLPTGINDAGQVVGYWVDDRDETHGFLWQDGRFTDLDLVGATSPTPIDINDRGDVVGIYLDETGAPRTFLLTGGGSASYTTISVPGAMATMPTGINDDGQVVGYTADDVMLGGATGFRRLPAATPGAAATYESVAVPGAPRTLPLGLNDRGTVVGLNESPDESAAWPISAEEMPAMSAEGSTRLELADVRGITVNAAIAAPLEQLLAAAEADGLNLSGGGHRSPEEQIELRRQHCGDSYYAIYEMPSSQCSPPTARPGRSLHERGLAIDFTCDGALIESHSDPCFQWMATHATRYGFFNLASEPWHWSLTGQ
jgi:probable HAF family extracellular repeat protein